MLRLLYLYPEEWTYHRARELHTIQTCLAMAETGIEVSLVTAGNLDLTKALSSLGRENIPSAFKVVNLSRKLGHIKALGLFRYHLKKWTKNQPPFDVGYVIHLKAAQLLREIGIPYWWEAHEIFAETPQPGSKRAHEVHILEEKALSQAVGCIATSQALANALKERYFLGKDQKDFVVVGHGGEPPLDRSIASPDGPLLYAGSIANWKGLDLIIKAAFQLKIPLQIIGGTKEEWSKLAASFSEKGAIQNVEWKPKIDPYLLPHLMKSARAGLIPTLPHTPSGRYSLPMKLFEYARCGIPVISANLPSLQSLGEINWCSLVDKPIVDSWMSSLAEPFSPKKAQWAIEWAAQHTWNKRGEQLRKIIFSS